MEVDLAVGDGNDIGGDVGRDIAGFGFNDRQSGERACAPLVAELGGSLQKAAVEVEDIAGVGFAAGRAAQQQGHLAVGFGLLGEVVIDGEGVCAVVHPVLAHSAAGVGSEIFERGRVGSGGDNDHGVFHSPVRLQGGDHLGDCRRLLADGHIDAIDALAGLIQDGVYRDGGFACFAVADD